MRIWGEHPISALSFVCGFDECLERGEQIFGLQVLDHGFSDFLRFIFHSNSKSRRQGRKRWMNIDVHVLAQIRVRAVLRLISNEAYILTLRRQRLTEIFRGWRVCYLNARAEGIRGSPCFLELKRRGLRFQTLPEHCEQGILAN